MMLLMTMLVMAALTATLLATLRFGAMRNPAGLCVRRG